MQSQRELIYKFLNSKHKSLLIVLDACRYDAFLLSTNILKDFKMKIIKVYSCGSCTKDWLICTFTKPISAIYISANPWVSLVFKKYNPFKKIVDLSLKFWDNKIGTVRAEYVNLIATKYIIKGENVIAHYLQPHVPFVVNSWLKDSTSPPHNAGIKIYRLASRDREALNEFRRAYIRNLKYVLSYVKRLIKLAIRLNYEVVITSDHGELLGEYAPIKTLKMSVRKNIFKLLKKWLPYAVGYYRVVGHPCRWTGEELYEVPWAEVSI